MFGSQILEVAIGIIFIYILISIICTALREGIESRLKTRAAYLEYGIRQLLQDKNAEGIAKSFYNHPLIYSLFTADYKPGKVFRRLPLLLNGANLPSYIPSKNFALALLDIAARGPETDVVSSNPNAPLISLDTVRMNILNLGSKPVQRALLAAIDSAQGDLNRAQKNIEDWYDSAMDRVSGWYKRSTQQVIFWIGLILAVGLNINTITIGDYLYTNDAARTAMVARAEASAKDTSFTSRNFQEAKKELQALSLPIGWEAGWGALKHGDEPGSKGWWNNFWAPVLGWLLTALAATMGAPFWFDLLNKVMVIRSTVKPHEKSPEEDSEDRQTTKKQASTAADIQPQIPVVTERVISPFFKPRPIVITPSPRDAESGIDGCEVEIVNSTPDENLPAAEGGVA